MTYSIISKSCNKLLIGKTYWKSCVLPAILFGTSLINMTEKDIEELQKIENCVYRHILGAPSYAPVCTLRGEVGASSMKARIIKGRIMYLKSIYDRNNNLLKEIASEMEEKDSKWMKITQKYLREVGLKNIRSEKNEEKRHRESYHKLGY